MDFVAIDFETANNNPNSACQLAAVVVRGSHITDEHCWLIRPPSDYFSPRNIAVHGIRPSQVRNSPSMADVWTELQGILDGEVIIAHNARFDLGVLVHSLAAHDIACPLLEFTCTRLLARNTWPGREGYGLKPLGEWLGVDFRHHDALEDARCCAKIALACQKALEQPDLKSLEECLRVVRGRFDQGVIKSPRGVGTRSRGGGGRVVSDRWGFPSKNAQLNRKLDSQSVVTASAGSLPLSGKKIVLLGGSLGGLSADESQQLIEQLGGCCQLAIDADTNLVVACGTTLAAARRAAANAAELATPSVGVRVLSERQFRALLPAGKATLGF